MVIGVHDSGSWWGLRGLDPMRRFPSASMIPRIRAPFALGFRIQLANGEF
jgi:hypothetical protein